jgi:hypothetical protein
MCSDLSITYALLVLIQNEPSSFRCFVQIENHEIVRSGSYKPAGRCKALQPSHLSVCTNVGINNSLSKIPPAEASVQSLIANGAEIIPLCRRE